MTRDDEISVAVLAGALLGFLAGTFAGPDSETVGVGQVLLRAFIGATIGFILCRELAAHGPIRIPRFSLPFAITFGVLLFVPWWDCGMKRTFPLGTAYVNSGFAWQRTLLLHLLASAAVTAGFEAGRWVLRRSRPGR